MTVGRWVTPDSTTQSGAAYKANIDAAFGVMARLGQWFAPHQTYAASPNPDLSVEVDAGFLFDGATLTAVVAQLVTGFMIPAASYQRIDRVVIDAATGVASRVAGVAQTAGSPGPSAPAIPSGKLPCCQVLLTSASTVVTNSMITDERIFVSTSKKVNALTPGASVAIDLSQGSALTLTLGAAANAIANPTGLAAGMWGWFTIKQDGTGNRTIASWGSAWKFVGGIAPIGSATGLSTAAGAVDCVYWVCDDDLTLQCTFGKGFA